MATLQMLNGCATSRLERRYVSGCVNAEEYLKCDLVALRAERKRKYQKLFSDFRRGLIRTFFWEMARREYTERCLAIDDKIQEAKEAKNG